MSSTPENGGGKQAIPPYLSHKTFTNFIEGLRKGVPARIDRSVIGSLSGTAQAHLLQTLRYLNLIDADSEPTAALNQLATAQDAEKQRIVKELLIASYPFVFNSGVDLEKCTGKQFEELFAKTGASGDTLRKTLTFFMAMAKDGGIKLSPFIGKRAPRSRSATPRARGAAAGGGRTGAQGQAAEQPAPNPAQGSQAQGGTSKTITLRTGGSLTLTMAVNLLELEGEDRDFVFGLVDSLKQYEKKVQAQTESKDGKEE